MHTHTHTRTHTHTNHQSHSHHSHTIHHSPPSDVIGQFVASSSTRARGATNRYGHMLSKESRETTIANGRKQISQLAAMLRLAQNYIESAHNLFKLAVQVRQRERERERDRET